jgi:hypothetical protein
MPDRGAAVQQSGIANVIVCDSASFRMGGEAATPLRFFRAFRALGAQVTLLTHDRVRPELTKTLTSDELGQIVFFRRSAPAESHLSGQQHSAFAAARGFCL